MLGGKCVTVSSATTQTSPACVQNCGSSADTLKQRIPNEGKGMTDLLRDPQEKSPSFRRLLRKVEGQARAQCFPGIERLPDGACYMIWGRMKEILRKEHGIK